LAFFLYKFAGWGVYELKWQEQEDVADARVNRSEVNGAWCQPLYEEKAAGLILYGRALGLSHGEAEDVVQETFLALLQLPAMPADPGHYCLRAFRNRALNYHRSVWRRLAREWESLRWFERGSAQDEAEAEAMRQLANLPSEQREVIVLKIWNGMTFEAIGRLFGVSPNTVAGRYRYGMNKLKFAMKGNAYGRDESVGETVAILGAPPPLV
jgi:RNA polymerase sigma-70 factor, ECF subfamily